MRQSVEVVQWHTRDRAAHPYTRLYMLGMRLRRDDRAFQGEAHTLRTARRLQAKGNRPPTALTRLLTRVLLLKSASMPTWRLEPRTTAPIAQVLYVHGGGYVHPLTADYWRLVRALVAVPAQVRVPEYRLAPDATLDEVLPQLLELHADMTAARPDLPVVLMGDSAGGALVLAMAIRLRELCLPQPECVVMLSPWLDARLEDPEVQQLESSDPMLDESGLRAAGRWWAGQRFADDPLVSPAHACLADLPPLELLIGDRDILRPAVESLAEHAARDRAELSVHEYPAMFHVWMTRAIPEGRHTRRQLVELVRRRVAA